MRNELETIQLIEKYILNTLSKEQRLAFEKELSNNPSLQAEIDKQTLIIEAAKRKGLKKSVKKAKAKTKGVKITKFVAASIAVLGATALIYLQTTKNTVKGNSPEDILPITSYTIDNSKDTVIETKAGLTLVIPENAFTDSNGNAVTGSIDFNIQEAFEQQDILKAGLTTLSNGQLLETGGMFNLKASSGGKELKLANDKQILAEIPNYSDRDDMMLYDGEKKTDGSINWVNPKKFEKDLITYDITSLNFYPEGYPQVLQKDSIKVLVRAEGDIPSRSMTADEIKKLGFNAVSEPSRAESISEEDAIKLKLIIRDYKSKVVANSNIDITNKSYTDSVYYSYGRLFNSKPELVKTSEEYIFQSSGGAGINEFTSLKNFKEPITWHYSYEKKNNNLYMITFKATVSKGWKMFSEDQIDNYQITPLVVGVKNGSHKTIKNFSTNKLARSENIKPVNLNANYYSDEVVFELETGPLNKDEYFFIDYAGANEENLLPSRFQTISFIKKGALTTEDVFDDSGVDSASSYTCTPSGINPSKIKAIWNKKFNNTILATKEFEERLVYIHKEHSDQLLDVYTSNINKPLWYSDSIAAMISSTYRDKFEAFYKQRKGGVKISNRLTKKLAEYYKRKQEKYNKESSKLHNDYQAKKKQLVIDFKGEKSAKQQEEANRKLQVFNEEYLMNLKEAKRQLGYRKTKLKTLIAPISNLGWKNVDKAVFESTKNRSTLDYTDPLSGKKAVIKYEEASVTILNDKTFDRVFVYMIPDSLSSYNRMKSTDNINFKENLNELFNYRLVCIGYIDGESPYYYESKLVAKHYDIKMLKVSEGELNNKLKRKKSGVKQAMQSDINFYQEEKLFEKQQKAYKRQDDFTKRVGKFLFPDLNEGCFVSKDLEVEYKSGYGEF